MKIRNASRSDELEIRQIHHEAFGSDEGAAVAELAIHLLNERSQPEIINLVAESRNQLFGHIALSPVFQKDNQSLSGYILAPLAVKPAGQKKGIGTQLIELGIEEARRLGASVILVYGDPSYYSLFGFDPVVATNYIPGFKLKYPTGWQGIELNSGCRPSVPKSIVCVEPLNKPELW